MLRRYIIIVNFLLLGLGLFFIQRIFEIWLAKSPLDAIPGKTQTQRFVTEPTISATPKYPKNAFSVIISKDLFRPERTEWKSPTEMAGGAQVVAPKLTLLGVVLCKDFKWAWIQEEGGSTKPKRVSEGATVSHWKVAAIEPNAIRLRIGGKTASYFLIEPGKPKTRKIPPTAAQGIKPAKSTTSPQPASPPRPPMKREPKKPE